MLDLLFDQERITRVTKLELQREKEKKIAKAKVEARAEGVIETKRATAINMKRLGLDIQIIIECTGLSKDQIEQL